MNVLGLTFLLLTTQPAEAFLTQDGKTVHEWIAVLASEEPSERDVERACDAIESFGEYAKLAVPALLDVFERTPAGEYRVLEVLSRIGTDSPETFALFERLLGEPSWGYHVVARRMHVFGADSIGPLTRAITEGEGAFVGSACLSLSKLDDLPPDTVRALVDVWQRARESNGYEGHSPFAGKRGPEGKSGPGPFGSAAEDAAAVLSGAGPAMVAPVLDRLAAEGPDLRHARRVLQRMKPQPSAFFPEAIEALRSGCDAVREGALRVLARSRPMPEAFTSVALALDDENPDVRAAALEAFARYVSAEEIRAHALLMTDDPNWSVTWSAWQRLAAPDVLNASLLEQLIEAGPSDRARRAIRTACPNWEQPHQTEGRERTPGPRRLNEATIHVLERTATDDTSRLDQRTRLEAARALSRCAPESPATARSLIALLHVRESELGLRRAAVHDSSVPDQLAAALDDPRSTRRARAAALLGKLNPRPAHAAALAKALGDEDRGVRQTAAAALRHVPELASQHVPALLACLSDEDEGVRVAAAQTLVKTGDRSEGLVDLFTALVREGRPSALTALRDMGPAASASGATLLRALEHPHVSWERAMETLRHIRPEPAAIVPQLFVIARDDLHHRRRDALDLLAELGGTEAAAALLDLALSSTDPVLALLAASQLERLPAPVPELVGPLLHRIEHASDEERQHLLPALGGLAGDDDRALVLLRSALHTKECPHAARGLAAMGSAAQSVVDELRVIGASSRSRTHGHCAAAARRAIGELGLSEGATAADLQFQRGHYGFEGIDPLLSMGPRGHRAAALELAQLARRDWMDGHDAYWREATAQLFARVDLADLPRDAAVALVDLSGSTHWKTERAAFEALEELGPRAAAAAPELAAQLAVGSDERVRRVACILHSMGPAAESAVPLLTSALRDRDPEVVRIVAETLATMDGAAAPACNNLQTAVIEFGDVPEVRDAAASALNRICGETRARARSRPPSSLP